MAPEANQSRRLFQRARAGDREAHAELLARHRGELERRARSRLPPELRKLVDPSDVAQEVVLDAVRGFGTFEYRGLSSLHAWLLRILENRLRMTRRHFFGREMRDLAREVTLGAHSASGPRASQVGPAASQTSPSGRAMAAERKAALARHFEQLPEDYRTVLRLVKLEERSLAEAAVLLGRSENAVKKLLARALLRLEKELRGSGLSSGHDRS